MQHYQRDDNPQAEENARPRTTQASQKRQFVNPLHQHFEENTTRQEPIDEQIQGDIEEVVKGAQQDVAAARLPWYRSIRRVHILLTTYAVLLILFGILATFIHFHPVLGIDVTITREFQENQSPWLRTLMVAVSFIGNVMLLSAGLVVVAAIIFYLLRLRLEAIFILAVYAGSGLLNTILKLIVARPRPSASLVEVFQAATGASFPSGHVMSYIAFWGLLFSFAIILFKDNRWWQIAIVVISGLFVVLVGPSRVYLGDHWASDVLGAYIFGGVWLGLSLLLYLRLKERGVLVHKKKAKQ